MEYLLELYNSLEMQDIIILHDIKCRIYYIHIIYLINSVVFFNAKIYYLQTQRLRLRKFADASGCGF